MKYSLLLLLIISCACHKAERAQLPAPVQPVAVERVTEKVIERTDPASIASATIAPEKLAPINIDYTKDDSLSYQEYRLEKRKRFIRLPESNYLNPTSYAVLERNGQKVASFNVADPMGSITDIALFPFLNQHESQFVIRQEFPKNFVSWIVDLSDNDKVIFNSGDYGVYGDITPIDIDQDGNYELQMFDEDFDYFAFLSGADSPRPEIIFQYDRQAKKYLPANNRFADFVLKDIDKEIGQIHELNQQPSSDEFNYKYKLFSKVLRVTLKYIFVGKEQTAWAFYQREYPGKDKEALLKKIKSKLLTSPLYHAMKQELKKQKT